MDDNLIFQTLQMIYQIYHNKNGHFVYILYGSECFFKQMSNRTKQTCIYILIFLLFYLDRKNIMLHYEIFKNVNQC